MLVNRGGMRFRQGKPDAAIADLVEAIRLKPGQYQAYANLGLAYAGLRRWGEAIEQLDLAIARAAEQAILYRNRALVNLNRDDLDAALRDFGEAIRLASGPSPSLASDQAHRGRILHRGKRYEEALAAFDAALKIRPDDREFARLRRGALWPWGEARRPSGLTTATSTPTAPTPTPIAAGVSSGRGPPIRPGRSPTTPVP